MAGTSFVQTSFLGGVWSQSMQGRIDRPDYRTAMNVCLNTIPVETGAALRRPGTLHLGTTRSGVRAKLVPFGFRESNPYNMEFSNGILRFWNGAQIATTNQDVQVVSISSATPAVVETISAHGWSTENTVKFQLLGQNNVPLHNREFRITVTSSTTFSLRDSITLEDVDGSTLGTFVSGFVTKIQELATPYAGFTWQNVRSVQAEDVAVLLDGAHPQVLTVSVQPLYPQFAIFDIDPAIFIDGPYFSPIKGSHVSSSALNGVVTLTFFFQDYDAGRAYDVGDYVTSAGQGYRSLTESNQNNTPVTSPANWLPVNGGDPVNGGTGFTAGDVGRHVRLFSEPDLWDVGTTYSAGDIVSYEDGAGAFGYWTATGARWTWGRITGVSQVGAIPAGTAIGTMTGGGGLAAAFDGNATKSMSGSASYSQATATRPSWVSGKVYAVNDIVQYQYLVYRLIADSITTPPSGSAPGSSTTTYPNWALPPSEQPLYWLAVGSTVDMASDVYVGQAYSPAKQIQFVTITPPSDIGFTNGASFTLNVRASATAPSSPSDGTLLATTNLIPNQASPITLASNDASTSWDYVWVEISSSWTQPLTDDGSHIYTGQVGIAQAAFYGPNAANGTAITLQIVGDPLLYSSTIRTWRLGVYGDSVGWPRCGTWHESRLWLSGAVGNRVDGSRPGIENIFDFTPTAPSGVVAPDHAIAAVFDGPEVNTVFWMEPDEQGIICGTQGGEWLISPASPGALTPTNTAARRKTRIKCANIEPVRTEHTLAIVQAHKRKIMEYFAEVMSGKFASPNLTEKSKHLTVSGIAEIAYQQELAPILWARTTFGALIGATYKRDSLLSSEGPTFIGWHSHELGGGRTVESICVGPSQDGTYDSLAMVTVDNAGVRHVQMLTDLPDEGFNLHTAMHLDDAIVPGALMIANGTAEMPYGGLTLTGLSAHEGKEVVAWIGGYDCGDYTVENGQITVPFGDGVSVGTARGKFTNDFLLTFAGPFVPATYFISVGFDYLSRGQIVRPALPQESGTQAGPAQFKLRRTHELGMQLYGAVNYTVKYGVSFDTLRTATFKSPGGIAVPQKPSYAGMFRDSIDASDDYDNMLCWEVNRGAPLFMIAIGWFINTKDA